MSRAPYPAQVHEAGGGRIWWHKPRSELNSAAVPQLSAIARRAILFHDFPCSLMSVGKMAEDGTILIFTKDGVTVHKEVCRRPRRAWPLPNPLGPTAGAMATEGANVRRANATRPSQQRLRPTVG